MKKTFVREISKVQKYGNERFLIHCKKVKFESYSWNFIISYRNVSNALLSVGKQYFFLDDLIIALETENLWIIISSDNNVVNGTKFKEFVSTRMVLFEKCKLQK